MPCWGYHKNRPNSLIKPSQYINEKKEPTHQVKTRFKIRENYYTLTIRFLSLPFSCPSYSPLSPALHRRRCSCRHSSSPPSAPLELSTLISLSRHLRHFSRHLVWTFEKTLEFLSHGLYRTRFALTQTLSLSLWLIRA